MAKCKDCNKRANYGNFGNTKATHCAEHGKPLGLVDIKNKRCIISGCTKQPKYGNPDNKKLFEYLSSISNTMNTNQTFTFGTATPVNTEPFTFGTPSSSKSFTFGHRFNTPKYTQRTTLEEKLEAKAEYIQAQMDFVQAEQAWLEAQKNFANAQAEWKAFEDQHKED